MAGSSRSASTRGAEEKFERGTCAFWHNDEGWGAGSVHGRAGVGFAHFSFVEGRGYRYLVAKEPSVWASGGGPSGCDWSAGWLRSVALQGE